MKNTNFWSWLPILDYKSLKWRAQQAENASNKRQAVALKTWKLYQVYTSSNTKILQNFGF